MYKFVELLQSKHVQTVRKLSVFCFLVMKSLSYIAIDNYITIKTLMHFCQYTISFFKSKSMSILSRSDISSNQCKFMFAILLQLLLLFLYKCVFAYVIRIVDQRYIIN